MYGLMGKIVAQDGQREVLLAHLLQAAQQLSSLASCYLYVVSKATDDDHAIWVTEVWQSKDAHQASLQQTAIQELIAAARPLMAGMGERIEFDPIGGKGLPLNT